jgi:hypothetical protein
LRAAPLPQLRWDLAFLADNKIVRAKRFGIPAEAKSVRYPIRLLRYWFGYHLLREEAEGRPRALDVAEIGVHTGQMLEFLRSAPVRLALASSAVPCLLLGWKGLVGWALTVAYAQGLKGFFHRRLGGITGDVLGFAEETAEIVFLLVLHVLA